MLNRRAARKSLLAFTEYTNPVYIAAEHHKQICEKLEAVERGEIDRLMVFMPPRHGKSELASRRFPAWYLGRNPNKSIIAASYNSELAGDFGRTARNIVGGQEFGRLFDTGLAQDSRAAERWNTEQGGAYVAAGVGTAITGRGANVLLIDDPLKERQEADSETTRNSVWNWYTSTAYTRLMPGGRIVVIQTRWHEDDLSGWLLSEHQHEGWEVLNLPAIDDAGVALWPEQYDIEALGKIQRAIGARDWSALYQQRPAPEEGDYFKSEWLKPYDKQPARDTLNIYGASDYAVTADGGDYTCHVVIGVDPENNIYLLDLWRKQAASDEWVEAFCELVKRWKPIGWAEETGQINAGVGPFLTRRQRETGAYVAREQFPTRGDKAVRAQSIRGRMALGGLYVPMQSPWFPALRSELLSFPAGRNDDQCVAEGTLVSMADGSRKPIEHVASGDMVKTPLGPCEVEASCVTDESAKVFRVRTFGGQELIATGNHPVYVENKGFVRVDELGMMDQIRLEPSCSAGHQRQKLSNIVGIVTDATQTVRAEPTSGISMPLSRGGGSSTGICGKMLTGLFRKVTTFITSMATGITTRSKTSSACQSRNIGDGIHWLARRWIAKPHILSAFEAGPQIGMPAMRAANGIPSMASPLGRTEKQFGKYARLVVSNLRQRLNEPSSVQERVNSVGLAAAVESAAALFVRVKRSIASVATAASSASGPTTPNTVQRLAGCVIEIEALSGRARVRNLTVKNAHTYYANGFLTHNCDELGLVGQLLDRMLAGSSPRPTTPTKRDRYERRDEEDDTSWKTV